MPPMVIIGIDYDEGDQSTYRGVDAHYVGAEEDRVVLYATGDPVADFRKAIVDACNESAEIMISSSADAFALDGDGYRFDENDMLVRFESE